MQEEYPFVWPVIHISCHEDDNGIRLIDNSYIKWDVLHRMLEIINICFEEEPNSLVLLSMSSCYGLHAIKADWGNEKSPFAFVLGHEEKISWDDALIAFFVFYHNYASKRKTSDIALECMNNSINNTKYFKLFNSKGIYNLLKNFNQSDE